MEITNGLKGLKDIFCSSEILKKKVNKEGANSVFEISICAGVMRIKKDKKNISEEYFLLNDAIIKQIKRELNK